MAKIIDFPGNWQSRGNKAAGPPSPPIDGSLPQEYSRWWRLGRDILRCSVGSGLRLNSTGGLPDELARRLYQVHIKPEFDSTSRSIGGENDSSDLTLVHWMLVDLQLLREKKGWLTLTRLGQGMLEAPEELYSLIFDLTMSGMHWNRPGIDAPTQAERYQELAPASLALLAEYCNNWEPAGQLMDKASTQLALPEADTLALDWYAISLRAHFEPLGLIQIRCLRQDLRRWDPRDEEVRLSPLFHHFIGSEHEQ